MNKNIIILADSRQQKDIHITDYFDSINLQWQRATLNTGDYMAIRYNESKGIYLDYSIIIDTKKDIEEIAGNLCKTTEHERIKREIARAKELGNNRFIFLIADSTISCIDDLINWHSIRTQVKGETLAKIMKTMQDRYGCEFLFCKKLSIGKQITTFLTNNNE